MGNETENNSFCPFARKGLMPRATDTTNPNHANPNPINPSHVCTTATLTPNPSSEYGHYLHVASPPLHDWPVLNFFFFTDAWPQYAEPNLKGVINCPTFGCYDKFEVKLSKNWRLVSELRDRIQFIVAMLFVVCFMKMIMNFCTRHCLTLNVRGRYVEFQSVKRPEIIQTMRHTLHVHKESF